MRPRFEDDETLVEAFTRYDELVDKKKKLENELKKVQEGLDITGRGDEL